LSDWVGAKRRLIAAAHPADLTRLSEINGGVSPFEPVFEMIDEHLDVALHGPRSMPVWGTRYRWDVLTIFSD
jgi:hypothetical protein